jgi:thiamine pyrophosphate-dependent acetolactate synthase large subunit-like protein
MLDRRAAVARLLADRDERLLVVSGLGSPTYEVAAAGDYARNFYLWGAMGLALPLGLGLALARPGERVLVVTGDGELLMGLGALATAGARRQANLAVAVLDNEAFGETGGQTSHTGLGTDLAAVALACGFADAVTARDEEGLARAAALLRGAPGPVLAVFKIVAAPAPRILPERDGHAIRRRFRSALQSREGMG